MKIWIGCLGPLRYSLIVVAILSQQSCTFSHSGPMFSGGPSVSDLTSADGPISEFKTRYTTWLEFDRDLTIPVDNILAQIKAGNPDALEEAKRYFVVGLNVLQRASGI